MVNSCSSFLLYVLVQQGSPVHYQQPVRVVLRPGHTLELSRRDQFTHQDIAAALDTLPPVVGELHIALVKPHTVAINGEHGTCSQYVGVKAFLLERVVLRQSGFVHQIHRLFHRVLDVLVIRWKREEVVVDFLYIVW